MGKRTWPATLALAVLAACSGGSGSAQPPASPSPSPITCPTGSTCVHRGIPIMCTSQGVSYQNHDCENPGPACGANGHLKNKYVTTLSSRVVKLPSGKPFGRLLLRHSTICQTAWGEVFYSDAHQPPGFSITVTVVRPRGPHPGEAPSVIRDFVSPAFSYMLANNQADDGCVYATARVTVDGHTGPTATTGCRAS